MVQGKTKGLVSKSPNSRHSAKAAANTKKGQRAIAPKKAALVKRATLHQSMSAKINASVEKQMVNAASAGKLTIMKGIADKPVPSSSKPTATIKKAKS